MPYLLSEALPGMLASFYIDIHPGLPHMMVETFRRTAAESAKPLNVQIQKSTVLPPYSAHQNESLGSHPVTGM
jgi:hypothetical protein